MTPRGLMIVGTDTGVGKTLLTGALAGLLRARGLDVGIWKPVQSGTTADDPTADSQVLRALAGLDDPAELICPFTFPAAVTPELAAHLARRPLSWSALLAGAAPVWTRHPLVLVEGAGGWHSPLAEGQTVGDLAAALGLPVLVIGRAGLGTINHCLLTANAVRAAGLPLAGFILNGYLGELPSRRIRAVADVPRSARYADSALTNPLFITRASGAPVLGTVPHQPTHDRATVLASIAAHVDLAAIARLLTE